MCAPKRRPSGIVDIAAATHPPNCGGFQTERTLTSLVGSAAVLESPLISRLGLVVAP